MVSRVFVIAAVLTFVSVQVVSAQTSTSPSAQAKGASVDELETLSQQWMEAAQRHDTGTLERVMADDFTVVHPSLERLTTRAQWLAALPRMQTKQFAYKHLKVVHYGPSEAVVSAIILVDAVMDGRPFPPETAVIDLWQKRGDKWQVVTRYAVRAEELKNPPDAPDN